MSSAPVCPADESTDPALNVVSNLSQQPMQSVQDFHHADRCLILSPRQRTRWSAWTTPSEKGRQSGRSNDGVLVYAHCGHSARHGPRPVLVQQRALTETELKALRDVVSSHDRVVLLISSSSTKSNRYVSGLPNQ